MQEAHEVVLAPSRSSRMLDLLMATPLSWLAITGYRHYISMLERNLRGCTSVLDVGCGARSPLRHVPKKFRSVGVDAFSPAIAASQREGIHDEYHRQSVVNLSFPDRSFDAVVALDLIEHLEKDAGLQLLDRLERIAGRRVIIFTPNGEVEQDPYDDNPWQRHLSGWTPADFQERGYRVYGVNGLRALRGTHARARWQPEFFWTAVSNLTEPFVRNKPDSAYQLLAVKEVAR